jgi:tetratricopeptide (TPR) repeat protein
MPDDIKKEEEKKSEEKKELQLPPDIGKYLDEWTANPKSKVFVKIAEEYRKSGLIEEALSVCEKGLKENPNYLSGSMVLAKIYFDMGEYDKSLQETSKVTSAQSDNIMAQNLLLELYIKKGDKDNAIKTCGVISYLAPENEDIINKKRELEERGIVQEEEEAAEDEGEKPEEVEAVLKEEFVPSQTSSKAGTDEAEEPVVDGDSSGEEGFTTNTLADLYIKQGFYEKGLNIYKELLKESPEEPKLIKKIKEIEHAIVLKQNEVKESTKVTASEDEYEKPVLTVVQKDEAAGFSEEVKEQDKEKSIEKLSGWLKKIQNRGNK